MLRAEGMYRESGGSRTLGYRLWPKLELEGRYPGWSIRIRLQALSIGAEWLISPVLLARDRQLTGYSMVSSMATGVRTMKAGLRGNAHSYWHQRKQNPPDRNIPDM